ncbi:MAG: hypothetical protein KGJ02_07100, partial [Verrucomicrobiota bacterium]|nr:hypothetical protein [Verrucomicrobiota bacterium]
TASLPPEPPLSAELKPVPFNPFTPPPPQPPAPVVQQPPPEKIFSPKKHPSHYDTLVRFAAIELEGTVKKL